MSLSKKVPLGIDISKQTFDVALLVGKKQSRSAAAGRSHTQQFVNSAEGFEQLSEWLTSKAVEKVHGCMEATNVYGHQLASYLHGAGHDVSIVNPSRVKGYGQSQLSRTKNDRADAGLIARFCRDLSPSLWQPSPAELVTLQTYARRLGVLETMLTQEKNRLALGEAEFEDEIKAHITFLEAQQTSVKKRLQQHIKGHQELANKQQLLTSIIGIGEQSAAIILSEIGQVERFRAARALAAFAGLTPGERQSGSSIKGKTRLCKIGNARLRKAFYFPALTAIRYCPQIQLFRERLMAAGKNKMQVVGAVMHKLIRVVYGVLKSGQPFDAKKLIPAGGA